MIQHHKSCSADYPEKLNDEKPQYVEIFSIDDIEEVHVCSDCGAFEIKKKVVDSVTEL